MLMYADGRVKIHTMDSAPASNHSPLQDVIEQRRAWIKSAMPLDSAVLKGSESQFVLEVIERAQKLRLELTKPLS